MKKSKILRKLDLIKTILQTPAYRIISEKQRINGIQAVNGIIFEIEGKIPEDNPDVIRRSIKRPKHPAIRSLERFKTN